jgi:hypothetical protein
MFKMFKRPAPSLEEQLQILEECGIYRRPGISVDHLLATEDRGRFEAEPFLLALVMLGSETEEPPYERLSDHVWHLDTECIEDHGSYAAIAERMRDLSQEDLPITAITDYVDLEEGVAWLEFELDGQRVHWEPEVQDDWVDPTILSRFAELLTSRGTGRRFTYLDLKGQDCVIGCSTAAQLGALRQKTGLDFQRLT